MRPTVGGLEHERPSGVGAHYCAVREHESDAWAPALGSVQSVGAPTNEGRAYSYLIASPGFMLVARRRGKKITISVPTIAKTNDQPT